MILGKFKKSLLNNNKNIKFLEISENLNMIPMEKFIDVFQEESEEYRGLERALNILDLSHAYRKIINENSALYSKYKEIAQNFNLFLKFNALLKKRDSLQGELEISDKNKESSDILAIIDLQKKLNESITTNANKLKLLKEDFLQYKNKYNQIVDKIVEYKLKIEDLTKQKKVCFSQINQITTEMAGDYGRSETSSKMNSSKSNNNISNAEKIRTLQREAKDVQFEISTIKTDISQTQIKLEEITPIYESYKNDYQRIKDMINAEEQKLLDLESELKNKIKDNEKIPENELKFVNLKLIRPVQEIEKDIQEINDELEEISISHGLFNSENPHDLSNISSKLIDIKKILKDSESKLTINKSEKVLKKIFDNFQKLELIINNLESTINKFLIEIKISSQFEIVVSSNEKTFHIDVKILRNNKERVKYDDLTTPEKIFFYIVFYISIKLHINIENIIFSNLSIPSKYNKAGSIFRTIRKILPVFEREEVLSKFNLIFIISNLEMKKEIKNLKIINL